MADFQPDDLTTFVVDTRRSELFYEQIGHLEPTQVKGMYFTQGDDKLIDMIVQDPDKNILFKRTGETEGIIVFTTTVPGEYTFIFSNIGDSVYDKTINFALHTYWETLDPLSFDFTPDGERVIVFDPNQGHYDDAPSVQTEEEMATQLDTGNIVTTLRSM